MDDAAPIAPRIAAKRRWLPTALLALGALILVIVVGYFVYSQVARSQLDDLNFYAGEDDTELAGQYSSIYPGNLVPALAWTDPRWADVDYEGYSSVLEGFTSPAGSGLPAEPDELSAPVLIQIPSIALASTVEELEVVDYGDALAWETPKNIVGHIPTTPNPGTMGNVYLFGHLQSPVRGEGSVFRNLARVPDLLRQGEKVYVVLRNEEDREFLYRVTQTSVVHQDEFAVTPSPDAIITMVACVPAYVYDHRLLVTAELVGVRG